MTASKLIISDGQKVILGRVKAGKATVTVGDAPEGGFPQRGDSTSAFPGWIQKHGEPAGYFYASNFGIPGIGEAYGDAYKSWFFLGNRIVCLGSGIACADKAHPIHTTLFQKALKTPDAAVLADGKSLDGFPQE